MVVGLVFEKYKPLLGYRSLFLFNRNRYDDGAGVDLVGYFHILKLAFRTKLLHGKKCNVHQADEFVIAVLI